MKKTALVVFFSMLMSINAYAQGAQIRLYKNYDKEIQTSCPIIEKNDTIYVGARDLCSFALGNAVDITWIDDAKMCYLPSLNARIYAGSCEYQVYGQKYTSAQPAEIVDGRLMIPIETAEALAGVDNKCFYYDPENCNLNYLRPEYKFANASSDYYMDLIAVDLKGDDFSLLQSEIEKMAGRYDGFTKDDKMTVKSVTEVSEGFGTIVFTVSGEHPRDIAVQIRHGYALKVQDPYNLTLRDGDGMGMNGSNNGNGYQHGKNI